jgi:hypothetical protein
MTCRRQNDQQTACRQLAVLRLLLCLLSCWGTIQCQVWRACKISRRLCRCAPLQSDMTCQPYLQAAAVNRFCIRSICMVLDAASGSPLFIVSCPSVPLCVRARV